VVVMPAPIKVMAHEGAYLCGQSERRRIKTMKRRKAHHGLLNLDDGVRSVGLTLLTLPESLPEPLHQGKQDQEPTGRPIEIPGLLLQLSEDQRGISRDTNSYVGSSDMLHYAIVPSFPLSPSIFVTLPSISRSCRFIPPGLIPFFISAHFVMVTFIALALVEISLLPCFRPCMPWST
jgi:hypothetical protein